MKIEILEDAPITGGYVEYRGRGIYNESWEKAVIHIPPPKTMPDAERLGILLHELGHIAGVFIGTEAQRKDVRFSGGFHIVDQSIVAAEEEAWDLADVMYENLKVYSQGTYGIVREYED